MDKPRPVGRPRAGFDGAAVRSYKATNLRLPDTTRTTLRALSTIHHAPAWRVVNELVTQHAARLVTTAKDTTR